MPRTYCSNARGRNIEFTPSNCKWLQMVCLSSKGMCTCMSSLAMAQVHFHRDPLHRARVNDRCCIVENEASLTPASLASCSAYAPGESARLRKAPGWPPGQAFLKLDSWAHCWFDSVLKSGMWAFQRISSV